MRATEAIAERDKGQIVPTPQMSPQKPSRRGLGGQHPLLSVAVEDFLEEGRRGGWTEKTRRDYAAWLRDFIEAVGDKPINQYGKPDGRAFKEILAKLPSNRKKKRPLRGLSIGEAAEAGQRLDLAPMSLENANKAMRRVSAFFTWADANHFDTPGPAPLAGMAFKLQERLQDKRLPFDPAQLKAIFTAPLYTGYRSASDWKTKGEIRDAAWSRFWVPLIGLLSGARVGEIFSLTTSDIVYEDGVALFNICASESSGKRVKSRAGIRRIPVHEELRRLGFLDLVENRKAQGATTLFHDCEGKTATAAADNFSKWFRRFLVESGVKTERHTFHSFRHNMEDAYRQAQVERGVLNALQGHQESGMFGLYGDGKYDALTLKGAIDEARFPGAELSRLIGYRGAV
jgi:integrase